MPHALKPMTAEDQSQFRTVYLAYLRQRDGVPDIAARRFDVRERFFADVDVSPLRWEGPLPVEQAVFDRNHALRHPEDGLDPVTLWALATAKTNRAERFGVELSMEVQQKDADAVDDPHTYIQIEEFYYTRILKDVLATIGLDMEVSEPHAATRLLVQAMVRLPEDVSNIAVLCGEIVGVTIFSLLLERARELFAAQPAALERIETLFSQILVDEVGHVHYLRSCQSELQLSIAGQLLPLVVRSVLTDIPELELLFGRDELLRRATTADVDAAAAGYPDRLVFEVA